MRVVPLFAATLGLCSVASLACAEPEWNVAAQTSLCGLGEHDKIWQKTGFCGALRGDLLFGRDRNRDFAIGPYATMGTAKFSDTRFGTGLSLLVPTFSGDFPVLLSAGVLTRNWTDVRLSSELFFGLRSHNFNGAYAMASGLVIGGDSGVSGSRATTLYVGLQVDALWLALPFILGYEWLRPIPDRGN